MVQPIASVLATLPRVQSSAGSPTLAPIKRSRVYEGIVQQIQELIREGTWAPGAQLPPERELADRLRVSRTSVREALRVLEMQGIIESRQGGGTFVRSADPAALIPPLAAVIMQGREELREILEVRELIEPGIARYAALRAKSEHLAELEDLVARQRECVARGRPFVDEDTAFHNTLAAAADNRVLLRLHNVVLDLLRESRQDYLYSPDRPKLSLRGHEAILAAIRKRSGEEAYQASYEHIAAVRDGILRALDGPDSQ